jgi:Fuc2NAc and GlcNAc transferase
LEFLPPNFGSLVAYFLVAAGASFFFCFPTRRLLVDRGVIDQPNARSSHLVPVARGGGIAVLSAFFLVGAVALNATWSLALTALAALLLAVVSFVDDLRSLRPLLRLAVHAAAALVALCALYSGRLAVLSPGATVCVVGVGFLWIIGYTNAFNFMDGINGIAGMQIVTTGVGTAIVGLAAGGHPEDPAIVLSIVLAGAGAGFLPHNFPRVRMFLGDVGSAPIGFCLAVLSFWLARDLGWWLLGAFALLHANFVLDTSFTLARRIWRRERCFEPHREHFYQRLLRAGKSHQFITGWEGLLQVFVAILVVAAVRMSWTVRIIMFGIVCTVWTIFFAYAELEFRRRAAIKNVP